MGSNLPFIFSLFSVAIVVGHAALTPELYWNRVLPGTSMPKAIRESLNPGKGKPNGASTTIGKGGVDVEASKGKPGHVGIDDGVKYYSAAAVGAGKGKPGHVGIDDGVKYYSAPAVEAGKGKPGHVGIDDGVKYYSATSATQLKDDPNAAFYFLEKHLVPGKTFDLQFTKAAGPASFLPREMADSIPFSSRKFTNILNRFSINPKSEEASIMGKTIAECESLGISGEQKYCATSLESMIDFSTKILGKENVKAVSTESNEDMQIKKYKIENKVNSLTRDEKINAPSAVCHKRNYVYAVFYCHSIKLTKVYMVPLKSEDGTEVKAVAVCHMDTSKWNPKHLAFQVLKVKPGTPVCHFPAVDTVVWYLN